MDTDNRKKGACIVSSSNGSKECVPEVTQKDCADICADKPDAKCELSKELTCPRGK